LCDILQFECDDFLAHDYQNICRLLVALKGMPSLKFSPRLFLTKPFKLIKHKRVSFFLILWISIALHICLVIFWASYKGLAFVRPDLPNTDTLAIHLKQAIPKQDTEFGPIPNSNSAPALLAAPAAPTAEEWQMAATYTLKNSKRYRYNWGQQVRSMMGTSVEGKDQGLVRFLIEIAPSGTIVKVDTLWKTSDKAEQLARKAIQSMPPLPPTPTGKPLIFEKTISFLPYETGWPPSYKYDCLPDPPSHGNAYAWDGISPQNKPAVSGKAPLSEEELRVQRECLKNASPDSLDAYSGNMRRQFEQWRSNNPDINK
jgi:hypothetical protein